jgi:hypothetical protein
MLHRIPAAEFEFIGIIYNIYLFPFILMILPEIQTVNFPYFTVFSWALTPFFQGD